MPLSFDLLLSASRRVFRFQGFCSRPGLLLQGARAPAEDQGGFPAAAGSAGAGGKRLRGPTWSSAAGRLCSGREGGTAGGAAPGRPREGGVTVVQQSPPLPAPVPPHPESRVNGSLGVRWVQQYRSTLGKDECKSSSRLR